MVRFFPLLFAFAYLGLRCSNTPSTSESLGIYQSDTAGVALALARVPKKLDSCQIPEASSQLKPILQRLLAARCHAQVYRIAHNFVFKAESCHTLGAAHEILDYLIACAQKDANADTLVGKFFNLKGYFYQTKGNFHASNACYEQALQKLPLERFVTTCLIIFNNIGQNYNSIGDYKKAEEYTKQALGIIWDYPKQLGKEDIILEKTRAWRTLGWAYLEQGKSRQALVAFNTALPTASNGKRCDLFTFISKSYLELHQYDSAFISVYRAINFYNRYSKDEELIPVDAIHQLARCHLATHNYEMAKRLFFQEIGPADTLYGQSHPDFAKIWVYVGDSYEGLGQLDSALWAYHRALNAFFPKQNLALPNQNPTATSLFGDYWLLKAFEGKARCWEKQTGSLATESTLQNLELAVRTKEKMVESFETDTSKQDLVGFTLPIYEKGIAFALKTRDTLRAYRFARAGKAALLRAQLQKAHAFGRLPDTLKVQYQALRHRVNNLEGAQQRGEPDIENTLLNLKIKLSRLEAQIKGVLGEGAYFGMDTSVWAQSDWLKYLPKHTLLLDYFCGEKQVFAFGFSQQRAVGIVLGSVDTLKTTLDGLLPCLQGEQREGTEQHFLAASRRCYQWLVNPLLKGLGTTNDANRLWIAPDGILHRLPFEALLEKDADSWVAADAPFLLRRYAIGYAFAAQQFFWKPVKASHGSGYVGWGIRYDPITLSSINSTETLAQPRLLATRDYGSLPHAVEEVELAHCLLGGRTFLDADATKQSFVEMAGKAQICHLAMHAIADVNAPQYDKLVFSALPNKGQLSNTDHFLFATSLYALPMQADLVLLSACNTATGQVVKGEGVASMGRAFQFAGARSVLITQWQVEDQIAAALVPAFLKEIKKGKPKDEALRHAKLALLAQPSFAALRSPAYWSCFLVSGDLSPIDWQDEGVVWWIWALLGVSLLGLLGRLPLKYKNF